MQLQHNDVIARRRPFWLRAARNYRPNNMGQTGRTTLVSERESERAAVGPATIADGSGGIAMALFVVRCSYPRPRPSRRVLCAGNPRRTRRPGHDMTFRGSSPIIVIIGCVYSILSIYQHHLPTILPLYSSSVPFCRVLAVLAVLSNTRHFHLVIFYSVRGAPPHVGYPYVSPCSPCGPCWPCLASFHSFHSSRYCGTVCLRAQPLQVQP